MGSLTSYAQDVDVEDDEEPTPRRGSRPLTDVEQAVRDASWPGFNFGKKGWPDPDSLRGRVAVWTERGKPTHHDGTVCACPLGAAWSCTCPSTCSRCERRAGLQPFGRHRYGGLWPVCPSAPGECTCPDYSDAELADEIERHRLERWFLSTVSAPPRLEQRSLFDA